MERSIPKNQDVRSSEGGEAPGASLRSDLETVSACDEQGVSRFFIKDPQSGDMMEMGEEEYFICTQLDGHSSLSLIQSGFQERFNLDLPMEQLKAFIRQLGQGGFLEGEHPGPSLSLLGVLLSPSPEEWKSWTLFNPSRLVTKLARLLSWCYTRAFVIFSVFVLFLALGVLTNNFPAFLADLSLRVVPLSMVYLLATFVVFLNIPFQLVRGMTSVHFGGRADDCGIHLVLDLVPVFYCRSRRMIWDIRKKADRKWVLIAPTYYAALVASLGVLCWKMTTPDLALHTFGIVLAVQGTLSTLLRLNLLWPTDMSYILANWLEIPDLRKRSISVAKAWLLFRPLPEPLTRREKKIFRWYGLTAGLVTLVSIVLGIVFASEWLIQHLAGTGALMGLLALIAIYRRNLSHWLKIQKVV